MKLIYHSLEFPRPIHFAFDTVHVVGSTMALTKAFELPNACISSATHSIPNQKRWAFGLLSHFDFRQLSECQAGTLPPIGKTSLTHRDKCVIKHNKIANRRQPRRGNMIRLIINSNSKTNKRRLIPDEKNFQLVAGNKNIKRDYKKYSQPAGNKARQVL